MKSNLLRNCLAMFGLVFALTANSSYAKDRADTYHVKDFKGREVVLKQAAKRIVALAPHIVENIYSAGAGDALVGAVDYCDYPEQAKSLPRVGAISTFSLEAIIAQRPDLVVVWYSGHGAKVMDKLIQLGLPVYASDPRSLPDVAKAIRDYGTLAGTSSIAEPMAARFEKRYHQLQREHAQRAPISVLYQVWHDPIQTLNDSHIISDVVRLCGGKNIFGDAVVIAPQISVESVISRDPEVIIASGMDKARPEWLDTWRQWDSLQAVKKDNLYFIPPDIIQRHTVRLLEEGAVQMCEHLKHARAKQTQKPTQ